jgi:hypothetical protein
MQLTSCRLHPLHIACHQQAAHTAASPAAAAAVARAEQVLAHGGWRWQVTQAVTAAAAAAASGAAQADLLRAMRTRATAGPARSCLCVRPFALAWAAWPPQLWRWVHLLLHVAGANAPSTHSNHLD